MGGATRFTGCDLLGALLDLLLGADDLLCRLADCLPSLSFRIRAFTSSDSLSSFAFLSFASKLLLLLLSARALLDERLATCNLVSVSLWIHCVALASVFAACDKRFFFGV